MSLTTRRTILKGLAGAGAAAAVSGFPFVNRLALGQQSLKLGVVVPQTGPMALEAQEMLAATQIAVEDVNADGGVMGRKVETVIRDSEFKPEVAKRKATELVEVEKAPFLVGAIVGFEGIAMAEVGCKNDVIVSFFGQNFLTVKGKMCKYQFGNNLSPYQTAAAAAHFVTEQKMGKKWHMLANNYSWPQMFERAYSLVAKQVGADWTGVTWAPLGTRDFLPFLPKVAAAKADVVFITTWAADQVACAKQVQEFGLAKQARVIHSITELTFAEAAGAGVYDGFYSGMPWYWHLKDKYPAAKKYYDRHLALRKRALVMGPDCGTAILDGVPLGFANAVRRGPIGLAGASGTGLQQVVCLIDRLGMGISQAIGVGGRDLDERIGGLMMLAALDRLADDSGTTVIVLISKPPSPLGAKAASRKPRKVRLSVYWAL